jgi:hypothetical protein
MFLTMIRLLEEGRYSLGETKNATKILMLNTKKKFAWVVYQDIGELLVATKKDNTMYQLSLGNYRLYEVANEEDFVDQMHLELFIGDGVWQGYLLPTGLPQEKSVRKRIIPTDEVITKTHA